MPAGRAETIADGLPENVGGDVRAVGSELDADEPRLGARCLAEADDLGAVFERAVLEPLVMRIVAIDDRGAARLEPAEDFRLGVGDLLHRAEETEMDRRHGGDDGDMRPDQAGQEVDLARMVHADLEHAEADVLSACWRATAARPNDC